MLAPRRICAALAALAALAAPPARAHIVYAGPTLAQLVATSELVARARIAGEGVAELPGGQRRPVLDAELLEVWKGAAKPGRVRFAQHGHGVAPFEPGAEVVVFLQPTARVPELAALAGRVEWVSLQEHDDEWRLAPDSRAAVANAVASYAGLAGIRDLAQQLSLRRQLTLQLLAGAEPRLAASALQDVVRAGDALPLSRDDLATLAPLLADPERPVGLRAGVLAELERRGLQRGETPWLGLLDAVRPADLPAAIRAAGAHAGPQVTARLSRLLEGGDAAAAQAAAIALGTPGNGAAVEPLAKALGNGDARLRSAAIRGLGRIGTPEARRALERAAAAHADADTRRRAAAELRVLAGES